MQKYEAKSRYSIMGGLHGCGAFASDLSGDCKFYGTLLRGDQWRVQSVRTMGGWGGCGI